MGCSSSCASGSRRHARPERPMAGWCARAAGVRISGGRAGLGSGGCGRAPGSAPPARGRGKGLAGPRHVVIGARAGWRGARGSRPACRAGRSLNHRHGHWTFACTLSCPAVYVLQAKTWDQAGDERLPPPSRGAAIGTVEAVNARRAPPPGSDQRPACQVLRGSEDAPVQLPVGLLAEGHQDQTGNSGPKDHE